jgi:5-formyltetrahydrofolate cyclo-ligase
MVMVASKNKEKSQLRKTLLEKLLSLTKEELKRRSENVEQVLSGLPIYKEAKVVMAYYPLRGEVDITGMMKKAYVQGKRFCFPVMDLGNKDLRVFEVKNFNDDFSIGPFKVPQPDTEKTREVDIKEIDMVIVPGIAFDYQKNRLGRGEGFYDRFLKRLKPPAKKVGIAFDFQILNRLPTHHALDEKVDIVVSENFLI